MIFFFFCPLNGMRGEEGGGSSLGDMSPTKLSFFLRPPLHGCDDEHDGEVDPNGGLKVGFLIKFFCRVIYNVFEKYFVSFFAKIG